MLSIKREKEVPNVMNFKADTGFQNQGDSYERKTERSRGTEIEIRPNFRAGRKDKEEEVLKSGGGLNI